MMAPGNLTDLIGLAVVAGIVVLQYLRNKAAKAAPAV